MQPKITTDPSLVAAIVSWRLGGEERRTVVVKATFALQAQGRAEPCEPQPLFDDVHHEGNDGRSLALASDRAPRKRGADVLFLGCAYAPHGETIARRTVRMAVLGGARGALIDKSLSILGARRRHPVTDQVGVPEPFGKLPIRYELALGGASSADNPVGVGVAGDDPSQPSVLSAFGSAAVAGYGAIAPAWRARSRRLRGVERALVDRVSPELPADFDFGYFNAAPQDQQVAALQGDEELLLVGVHPIVGELRCRLPGLVPTVALHVGGERLTPTMTCDTLWVLGDALRCTLTWRGDVPLSTAQRDAPIELVARLGPPDAPDAAGAAELAAARVPASSRFKQTQVQVAAPRMPTTGFVGLIAPRTDAPPRIASPLRVPRIQTPIPGTGSTASFNGTVEANHPFVFPEIGAPASLRKQTPVPAPIDAKISVVDFQVRSPELADGAPISARGSPLSTTSSASVSSAAAASHEDEARFDGRFVAPARTTEHVPIVNDTTLQAISLASQLAPPQDVRVVVVKATFELVDDGAPTLAAEQPPPMGDLHHDDDPARSLRHASDFAPFKPKVDVTLVGSALAGAEGNVALVTLRLGAMERRLAVFGDRTWTARGASSPAPFDRMPLRWERALGGALSTDNPAGIGYETGNVAPNLEDPARLLTSPSAKAPPACFGPIAPTWRARASKLGTYDGRWLKTRWPYFPADFDFAYFNAAPARQQLEAVEGDERFELVGFSRAPIAGRLPGVRPRAFALHSGGAGSDLVEVLLRLDTVSFDVDARTLVLVWRGFLETTADDAPELALLFVTRDDAAASGKPMTSEEVRRRLHATLAARGTLAADAPVELAADNDAAPLGLAEIYARMRAVRDAGQPVVDAAGPAPEPTPRAPVNDAQRLLDALRDGLPLPDCTGIDASERDLRGAALGRVVLAEANLRGAKLDRAKLSGAVLTGVHADGASFAGADLSGADLSGAHLEGADLSGANVDRAVFDDARASRANLSGATGAHASFVGAHLYEANFAGARLAGVDFTAATLEGASFLDAELADARLYDCDGPRARFDRAKLVAVRADGARLSRASLLAAQADGSIWDGSDLGDATFERASLAGASFVRARLERTVLSKADLREACFRRARMRQAKLLKADLARATFERADLDEADLRGANLYQAETWNASMRSARLELANLFGTKLD